MNCRTIESFFDGQMVVHTYTRTGQRHMVADERATTTYSYDNLDWLIGISTAGNQAIGYGYNAARNRLSLTSASSSLTDSYRYTAFGDLFAQTGSTTNSYLFTKPQYDAVADLRLHNLPDPRPVDAQCCANLAIAHALLAQFQDALSQQRLVGIQLFAQS